MNAEVLCEETIYKRTTTQRIYAMNNAALVGNQLKLMISCSNAPSVSGIGMKSILKVRKCVQH